ncbi:hypothetical protein [Nocardia bhagyanarayanae]|uniref:DUF3800 domain-containing protein n=1 Tax=Nocardia bhagyanarayanae TaxID=1215925 RepID=A0A543F5A6_9NOCA|nr:hypothetical protein [Nocardia bhagyanarayanae]TQM29014.1 hypothetical protein FB390_0599 [Nocardia bhagyanarayanae]
MPIHAFVDESVRRDRYLLCAALIRCDQLAGARGLGRGFLLPGQRRWHFNHEPDQRRRQILTAMARFPGVEVSIYEGRGAEVPTRRECLAALVSDLIVANAGRLVIESRESQDHRDRHCIAEVLRKASAEMPYIHVAPHSEPALWWPDAVAWAFGAGGRWKEIVMPLVRVVIDVDKRPQ